MSKSIKLNKMHKGLNVSVRQMTGRTGQPVANQFIIHTDEGTVFQSYNTIIAIKKNDGSIWLNENDWDYSVTTNKYRAEFLRESTAETRAKIESGEYKTFIE